MDDIRVSGPQEKQQITNYIKTDDYTTSQHSAPDSSASSTFALSQQYNSNPFANESLMNFLISRSSNPSRESRWYYKDPTGSDQGPFTQTQMA